MSLTLLLSAAAATAGFPLALTLMDGRRPDRRRAA